jgi:heat shock protein HtpX
MGFVGFVVLIGWVFTWLFQGGVVGLVLSILVAAGMAIAGYWNSDKVALAMSRAQPASEQEYARLHNLVEGLCIASGLPKPRLYVVHDPAPNAFATGRNPQHAAVAVTTGLLEKMNRIELEGVLAHELSHIKNYDMLVMTLAVTMVGIVALLADFGVRMFLWGGRARNDNGGNIITQLIGLAFMLLAPLVARAMQAAVPRRRETLADVSAVEMTRYPPGLIGALEKLQADQTVVHSGSRATAHLWIEEPVERHADGASRPSRWGRMFDTHPPLSERIELLREL